MERNILLIGGSAGSFRPACEILRALRKGFPFPVVLALHRLKTINGGFVEALGAASIGKRVTEPFDKEKIADGRIYLAPANYHLCFEDAHTFALSTDPPYQFSRPSIDMTFFSAAEHFGKGVTAIILSGANRDGVEGAYRICQKGGTVLVQDPADSDVITMPGETLHRVKKAIKMPVPEIIRFLENIPEQATIKRVKPSKGDELREN